MPQHTIIAQGDWMWIIHREADTPEQALVAAAADHVDSCNDTCKLTATKVTGHCTPNLELKINHEDGELESTWTIPSDGD